MFQDLLRHRAHTYTYAHSLTHSHSLVYSMCYLLRFWNLSNCFTWQRHFTFGETVSCVSVSFLFSALLFTFVDWRRANATTTGVERWLHCHYQPVYVLLDLTWDFTVENLFILTSKTIVVGTFCQRTLFPPAFCLPRCCRRLSSHPNPFPFDFMCV